jgi:hypothetical protein
VAGPNWSLPIAVVSLDLSITVLFVVVFIAMSAVHP